MKITLSVLFFMFNLLSFSFSIDNLDFDKQVKENETIGKEFLIKNTSDYNKKYEISIKESKNSKILNNIKVVPSVLILKKNDSKKINIQVKNNGLKNGEYEYYLVIKERNIDLKKNEKNVAMIDKNINILQSFYVGNLEPQLDFNIKKNIVKNTGTRKGKFILEIHLESQEVIYSKVETLKINETKNIENILENSEIPKNQWDKIKKIVVLNI